MERVISKRNLGTSSMPEMPVTLYLAVGAQLLWIRDRSACDLVMPVCAGGRRLMCSLCDFLILLAHCGCGQAHLNTSVDRDIYLPQRLADLGRVLG